ncbi:hypothetical protein IV203_016704 [Nitzschia inconspicua]|uniref:Uncharacterized protein n=1 Tax=Nitzschia inconspicua TaxID=303405 RepID=A0A9K3PK86_9STRA|nr:hypothetical protein IV203_016704 [Nitzschia inconspicua]
MVLVGEQKTQGKQSSPKSTERAYDETTLAASSSNTSSSSNKFLITEPSIVEDVDSNKCDKESPVGKASTTIHVNPKEKAKSSPRHLKLPMPEDIPEAVSVTSLDEDALFLYLFDEELSTKRKEKRQKQAAKKSRKKKSKKSQRRTKTPRPKRGDL